MTDHKKWLKEAEARCEAATPGPWSWYGNTKINSCHLATTYGGRVFVMDFVRWGFSSAKPRFQVPVGGDGRMTGVEELCRYEVAPHVVGKTAAGKQPGGVVYRSDFHDIAHPDAELIARANTDLPRALSAIRKLIVLVPDDRKHEIEGCFDGP